MGYRRSLRLPDFDYTRDAVYFVTICGQVHGNVFGVLADGKVSLTQAGQIAQKEWNRLPDRFPHLSIDAFVVMPDHVHGLLILNELSSFSPSHKSGGATDQNVAAGSLGAVVRAYKSAVALRYNRLRQKRTGPLWQRNYYEHIVRDGDDLERIREYIASNPIHRDADA